MFESLLTILVQVSAALLLGAFFGMERRLRGYPDASRFHAVVAGFGLIMMVVLRPEASSLLMTMSVAIGVSFAGVSLIRSFLQAIAETPEIFVASGADTFTIAGALAAGCACGTGDVRSVAAVLLVMTVISIFRPLENYKGPVFAHGIVDTVSLVPKVMRTPPANDDVPAGPQDDQRGRDNLQAEIAVR